MSSSGNLFNQINFNIPPSTASSQDVRILSVPCDHLIRNEIVMFNISPIVSNLVYNASGAVYNNGSIYNQNINPTASIYITTQNPYVNNKTILIRQQAISSPTNPITETIIVPNPLSTIINLQYPPLMNTLSAQIQTYYTSNGQTVLQPYYNYSLSQLQGKIQFTAASDIGSTVQFSYVANKKAIPQTIGPNINYQYIGLNATGQGIFQIFGRAFSSANTILYLNYTTTSQYCPKCGGANYITDFNFDANGRVQMVYDFSKLIQDFFKRMLTEIGSDPFDLTVGTQIPDLVGMAIANQNFLETTLKAEIVNLIQNIRAKQTVQASYQTISAAEQIANVSSVVIQAVSVSSISVTITVTSLSGVTQQITQVVNFSNAN